MSARIVWQFADNSLAITTPVGQPNPGESETQWLDRLANNLRTALPEYNAATRLANVDHTAIPNRRFRTAWRFAGGAVGVSLAAARALRVAELRDDRDKRLALSDALRLKYDDIGTAQQKSDIAAYRQALRDVTTTIQADIAAISTVAGLVAYDAPWPATPAGVTP